MPWNANTLKRLRERRGLTQDQLAERAGIHRVSLARLEIGTRRPGIDLAEALARALKVTVDNLLKERRD